MDDALRCDLHVHSLFSGPVDLPVLGRFGNECYSTPREVYDTARARGMSLVTLTDHDSIEGALALAHLPDVFVSEEVTCLLPGGRQLHLGVFGIDEAQHATIQKRRRDAEALFAYLAEARIPTAVNHLFSALTGRRAVGDLDFALARVGLVETRNGMMPQSTNEFAKRVAERAQLAGIGGSDGHTLASVARAFTVVPGARTREDFLAGLQHGRTIPAGRSGSYARLTADVGRLFFGGYLENARQAARGLAPALHFVALLAAAPLLPLLPLVTAALYVDERLFGARYHRLYERASDGERRLASLRASGAPLALR
jgi:predicted metal-dependent phosphoesterase TrpH